MLTKRPAKNSQMKPVSIPDSGRMSIVCQYCMSYTVWHIQYVVSVDIVIDYLQKKLKCIYRLNISGVDTKRARVIR